MSSSPYNTLFRALRSDLLRVVPVFLVVGAGIELFMIKTGFYNTVIRNASERQVQRRARMELAVDRMRDRLDEENADDM